MNKDSLADIRKGYRQGPTGSHKDSGIEFAHGRSERAHGKEGSQLSKSPKARQDSGMEGAMGKPNQRSEMGHSYKYMDPTICRYEPAHTDRGMEHARGRSVKGSSK